ncbi:MAG TPA: Gfo/Idh/MocA family oxidoreductase [Anaerolineae bacterium]|nr:Gfo/Idh/MocA family oxidoreductase [Anaerolineae bacterium]HQH39283.1 Gfo/Idh/MocA family oxidoreductase [Anaerolineae bacterium]
MLRIAMLSFAHVHANGYAQAVVDHPEAEIAAIWEDDEGRGKAATERFGVPYETDLEKVVSRDDIDAVVINAYTSQHPWLMKTALKYGKHIFTEKALCISTRDADEIVELVNRSGIKFMISLPSRTRPETLFMKEVLDKGWLGKITLMRARVAHMASLDHWFHDGSAWFADAKLAGGGALFDLGCHTVDVMRWFMGKPRNVVAKIQQFSDAYPIDDNSAIVVEFENGALGILDTAWVHRSGPNPMEIYGTDGFIGRDPYGGLMLTSTQLQPEGIAGYIRPTQLPDAQPMPMDQWISAILHDTPMTITVEDGRNLTEMLERSYQAAREEREVKF